MPTAAGATMHATPPLPGAPDAPVRHHQGVCGRYVASRAAQELVAAFGVDVDSTGGALRPTFNAAPTSRQPVVRRAPGDGTDDRDGEPDRELVLAAWGLVPFFAREPTGGARTINARVETVLDKPSYRRAVRTSRCLVPVDGWYEWTPGAEGPRARKQPWFMAPADGSGLALAGICETWRPKDDPAAPPLVTFSVLTRDAQEDLRAVHDRMPVVLDADLHADWLDTGLRTTGDVADLLALARSRRAAVTRTPVGTAVGSVRSNGPELVVPVGPVLGG